MNRDGNPPDRASFPRPIRRAWRILTPALLCAAGLAAAPQEIAAAKDPEIKPGATFRLSFPELPKNLDGETVELSVRLPKTYAPGKKYPLALWVEGGRGTSVGTPNHYLDEERYIFIGLPIVKRSGARGIRTPDDPREAFVRYEDADTMWKAWSAMLARLEQLVPNIEHGRGVAGGFSNGAHSVSLALEEHTQEVRRYFGAFVFVEGGRMLKSRKAARNATIIVIAGDQGYGWANRAVTFGSEFAPPLNAHEFAKRFDTELIVMPGAGHEMPTGEVFAKARAFLQNKGF